MTAPRGSGQADAAPTPRALLLLPYVVILVAAALTPDAELHHNQADVGLYLNKAMELASGRVPYRDFPFEYPPLALVPMAAPHFAWPFGGVTVEVYKWLFAAEQAVLMLVLGFVLMRIVRLGGVNEDADIDDMSAPMRRVALRLFLLSLGAALALTLRFDLFPVLIVTIALAAALDGRPVLAGALVALGILTKLYPLALVPALAVPWLVPLDLRRLARYGLAAATTAIVVIAPVIAVAGNDAFGFLRYQADRGLQIESVGGGLAVLLGLVAGSPAAESFGFGAVQVEGPFAAGWLGALPVLTVVGFGILGALGWRRIRAEGMRDRVRPDTVVLLAATSVLVLIATSKVFSIQYVVWIVPFAALLRGRQFWLALAMVALTMPIHPLLYGELVRQAAVPVLILNLRNALLLALTGWLLWDVARPAGLEPTTFRSAT